MEMTITTLIERLEKATGPDRMIDADIYHVLGLCGEKTRTDGFCTDYKAPEYSRSIDAALTLVPDGMQLSIEWPIPHANDDDAEANIYTWDASGTVSEDNWYGRHKLAPIALCIAALKARL